MLLLYLLTFGLTIWFGLYLIARNPTGPQLLLAGLGLIIYALGLAVDLLSQYGALLFPWQPTYFWLLILPWLGSVVYLLPAKLAARTRFSRFHYRLLILATTLFFGLGLGLLFIDIAWLPRFWLLMALGLDLILLGGITAVLDALEKGEALWPDLLRAFDYAFFTALLFGGLVGLTIYFSTGVTPAMLLLLLATITAAVTLQIFADPIQNSFDRIALAHFPQLRQARTELRTAASALPRRDDELDLNQLDEAEFVRLTRRALSYMGDLPRLVASPLTRLPLIRIRLAAQGKPDDALGRANELKALLSEAIERLKPESDKAFDTTDAWRHYNVLYFPYVVGLRPYSRRANHNNLDPVARQALAWFQQEVPERTLYNWQTAAAQLVAQALQQQEKSPAKQCHL
jgi:hypothetical protein